MAQLNGQGQKVVISGAKSCRWSVVYPTMGQCKAQFCFKAFVSNMDNGPECTLSRFADDTKLGVVADAPQGHAAIKRDLKRLEEWSDRNLMEFLGQRAGRTSTAQMSPGTGLMQCY